MLDFYRLSLFSQIYFSYFSEELLLPAPHNVLRIQKFSGTDVQWSFEISLQPDCMGVWVMKGKNACQGQHVGCVQKMIAFMLIPVLVSPGSGVKICDFLTPSSLLLS